MIGAVIIVIVLLVLPILICMSGAAAAGVIGWALKGDSEASHEGSELIALNR